MALPPWSGSSSQQFVLVTGCNSGLGFSYCERLIDEFLASPTRDPKSHLVLIVSTRSPLKTRLTIGRLRRHVRDLAEHSEQAKKWQKLALARGGTYDWKDVVARIHFLGLELDLCDLRQVYEAAARVRGENGGLTSPDLLTAEGLTRTDGKGVGLRNICIPRLDAVVMNAGMVGQIGINYPAAVWAILTDMPDAVMGWDHFYFPKAAVLARQKISSSPSDGRPSEESTQGLLQSNGDEQPALGQVFCANVFGHYILGHELMPLLSSTTGRAAGERSRLIWMTSIEAEPEFFDVSDIQGLHSENPYNGSKRLSDILTLTATLPSVRSVSSSYFTPSSGTVVSSTPGPRPEIYAVHPGIVATGIIELHAILAFFKMCALYLARVFGSIWHPMVTYSGALAPVWVTLAPQAELDTMEGGTGDVAGPQNKLKIGSCSDFWGNPDFHRTHVAGWGWDGTATPEEEMIRQSRKKKSINATKESRDAFEEEGRKCWAQMEALRKEWEVRLRIKG